MVTDGSNLGTANGIIIGSIIESLLSWFHTDNIGIYLGQEIRNGVFMHKYLSVDLTYGCGKYDYKKGRTIICVAPGR